MYVQVAHYRLGAGSVQQLADDVREGPLKVMREVPGFVEYYAFDTGGGLVASVTVFESQGGVEEADRRLSAWVEATIAKFDISPGEATEGAVFATTRSVP